MSFRLVPNSATLNGVMAAILRYFTKFGSFRGPLHKSDWDEDTPILSATEMLPKESSF